MLDQTVLAVWALTVGLAAAVGARVVLLLRRDHGPPRSRYAGLEGEDGDGALAVERLLDEVGGVVDLIEAEAARLEVSEDGRTLSLASSLLASSMTRYRESVPPER